MYNIKKATIIFKGNAIQKVTVIAEVSPGDVRKISATTKPVAGYFFISPNDRLNEELFQKVAASGMQE